MEWFKTIKFGQNKEGLISFDSQKWNLYLLVFPDHWMVGHVATKVKWYKKIHSYGLGPFFLYCQKP